LKSINQCRTISWLTIFNINPGYSQLRRREGEFLVRSKEFGVGERGTREEAGESLSSKF
jgi:hypothetical protein